MNRSVSHLQAIGFALVGFTLWVLCDACIKLAGESALPFYEVAGFMGTSGAVVLLVKALLCGEVKTLWPKRPRAQMIRAVLSVGTTFCNVIALRYLSLSIFYILAFTTPLIVAFLAVFFLQERLGWQKTIAILAGFGGVVIALYSSIETGRDSWTGYVVMGIGVLIGAGNAVWLRRMSQTETINSLVFSQMIAGSLIGFAPTLFHAAPVNFYLFMKMSAAGILDVAGMFCYSIALKHTSAANVAQFHYTQIISGALIGYLVWNEMPTAALIVGSLIIISSGIYIAMHAGKAENKAASTHLGSPL